MDYLGVLSCRCFIFHEWVPYHGNALEAICLQLYEVEVLL
jgi:hypothetical protein